MGILFDMKAFFLWLEDASDKELSDRYERVVMFSKKAETENAIEEAKYLIKKMEEEILTRMMR